MASRLRRWSYLTALAIGAALVTLLPPGISPLALWYGDQSNTPTDALTAEILTNRIALSSAELELRALQTEKALTPFRESPRSPLVVHTFPDSVRLAPSLTAEADLLWRSVAHHPDAPRSLLLVSGNFLPETHRRHDRALCIGKLIPYQRWGASAGSPVRSGAGGCLLATEFGPPGRALDDWLGRIGSFYIPGAVPGAAAPVRTLEPGYGLWFEADQYGGSDRLPWWSSIPIEACTAGRSAYCVDALGFGVGGLDSLSQWSRAFYSPKLFGAVPASLLADLGPERFGEVWRGDDPLPVAYAKVSGRPFADWALGYVQQRVGRLEKDNALSLAGWLGWSLWMVLLVGWLAARMREQPAQ